MLLSNMLRIEWSPSASMAFLNFVRGIIFAFQVLNFFPFFLFCCPTFSQNTSSFLVNETTADNSMRLNPHIRYYSTVYVASMAAALVLKTMRGLVFVKVSEPLSSNNAAALHELWPLMDTWWWWYWYLVHLIHIWSNWLWLNPEMPDIHSLV